ncbi:hypothetical protein EVJ58_g1684 [Rhodofomes roseus]|uniref:Uncharacterized protein n=1 Tax=Rhodofomes roseus TaxID=34475 RepID=A0A4Y9Z0I2_9APHY|nr:hypothetical protein EVJ58_g1684 [Rhodofomes roseus]
MRSSTAVLLLAAAASVTPAFAAPISYTSDLEVRGDFDSLEVRDIDNTFARRELQDELFTRALNDELVARSKIGKFFKKIGHGLGKVVKGVAHLVLKREDLDVLARELGIDEEVFARDFDANLFARDFDEEVFARDFDEEVFARDFDDDLFVRDFVENLFTRDLDENQFVARAFGVDEELVARSKIGNRIKHAFQKIGHVLGKVVKGVAHLILKREDMDVLARELGIDEELFARAFEDDGLFARSFDEYEFAQRDLPEELFTRMLMEEIDARGVEETQQASQPNAAHSAVQPHAHEANSVAHPHSHETHPNDQHHTGVHRNGEKHTGTHRNGKGAHRKGEHRGAGLEGRARSAPSADCTQEHHSTQHTAPHQTREDALELLARAFGGEFDELD